MPFVKEKFVVPEPILGFLFVMREFGLSQGEAQRLIGKGRLLIDGESYLPSGGTIDGEVEIVYFKPKSRGLNPIFQTPDFLVYDKPSGVLVHPNTMATPYSILDEIRHISGKDANAVHRIDMETSGLLLASKHKDAERFLKNAFEIKSIKKSYLAWVDGRLDGEFTIDEPIRINNDYSTTKHKVFIDATGKHAKTDFKAIHYDSNLDATLMECYPHTGRTHQIRVHLFHVKHPILGDPIYGCKFKDSDDYLEGRQSTEERYIATGATRLMLHAQSLEFEYGARYHIVSRAGFGEIEKMICPKGQREFNRI